MSSKLSPAFAYTVVYVKDVAKSVSFYAKRFCGQTTIAFTPKHQHETDDLTGEVQDTKSQKREAVEVCFSYEDVDAAFKRAVGVFINCAPFRHNFIIRPVRRTM
ncbi:hypothetical protein MKX03_005815 [Papaver bracteatum]|nr:hypothetical protein MKX03_005815 [Papaver bracteatum]